MKIGSFLDLSSIDYPRHLCSIIFLSRCNFKCPYCQNYEILERGKEVEVDEIVNRVKENFLIDSLCISGGEPLLQIDKLIELLNKIRDLKLKIKIDTNGYYYKSLQRIIEEDLVDYIALDFKTAIEKYDSLTKKKNSGINVLKSLEILASSNIEFEVRTTVVPTLINKDDIIEIASILKEYKVKNYFLQQFRNASVLDKRLEKVQPYSKEFLQSIADEIKYLSVECRF